MQFAAVYSLMPKHHHRCNLCGRDFEAGDQLREHVERRHPRAEVHFWMVAEDPANLPFEVERGEK